MGIFCDASFNLISYEYYVKDCLKCTSYGDVLTESFLGFLVADTGFHCSAMNSKLLPGPRFDLEEWIYKSAFFLLSTPNPQMGLLGMW